MVLTNKKKMAVYYFAAIFFIAIDRFLKVLSLDYFQVRKINLVGDLLNFTFSKNYYIALSIPVAKIVLMIVIPILILCLMFYSIVFFKKEKVDFAGLLTIISFCAISNYYDRLVYGFVIDYLELKWFTVLNLADIIISVSVFIFIIVNYKKYESTSIGRIL
jgi:signal peptidase II